MKLYLDSLNLSAWNDLIPTNLFYGITTNPLLARQAGLHYPEIEWQSTIGRAADLGVKELHIQVPDTSQNAISFITRRQREAESLGVKVVIKIPMTEKGIRLVTKIKPLGQSILMTACYHANQYIIAEALGADYIAPYFGRMHDAGIDAPHHLSQMKEMANRNGSRCKVLVASLRTINQLTDLATTGHEYFTLSPVLVRELISNEFTEKAACEFAKISLKVGPK